MSTEPAQGMVADGDLLGRLVPNLKVWLESIAALIGIMGILLPVEGALIRLFSFGFAHVPTAIDVNASVPELAVTGLQAIYTEAGDVVLGIALVSVYFRLYKGTPGRVIASVLAAIGWPIAASFLYPDWIGISLALDAGILAALVVKIDAVRLVVLAGLYDRRYRVGSVLYLTVYLALFITFTAALSGNPATVDPRLYSFQAQVAKQLPDGRYVTLGHSDGITYLQSCKDLTFHAVPNAQILDARYAEHARGLGEPSIWEIVTQRRGLVLGYRPDC